MKGRVRSIVLMALLYVVVASAQAEAAVYWGSPRDGIGAASLDGSSPQWDYFYWPFGNESAGPACGVAVTSEYLYWAGAGGIGRRKFDGEGVYPATVVPHLSRPCGLATDGAHIYWGDAAGSIGRANLDGSEARNGFITGLERPCDITISGAYIYWAEKDGIGRANLDGSAPQRSFIPVSSWSGGCGLAASASRLYWGQDRAIAQANLEGEEIDHGFIPDTGAVNGIALDSAHIYWAGGPSNGNATLGRANLDGGEAQPAWISSNSVDLLGGVAVDARSVPPYLTLPSRAIRLADSFDYNLRSGAVLLGVYVPPQGPLYSASPAQGQLTVVSQGLSWKVFPSPIALPSQGGSSLWQVRIRSGKGKVGRRVRSQLRSRGWARVKVRLRYETARVFPVEEVQRVVLRRYRGAAGGWVKHPGPPPRR